MKLLGSLELESSSFTLIVIFGFFLKFLPFYDSSINNVKRSFTTQDFCSFQKNKNTNNLPIFEENETDGLEWDDYLPVASGNAAVSSSSRTTLFDDQISNSSQFTNSSQYTTNSSQNNYSQFSNSSMDSSDKICKIRNWGDQALNEISQMIQNDEQQHRECVREGAKVFDWPSHAIVDRLNVGLTIAEE